MNAAPDWYASLMKPIWAPPAWVFGPVWTGLYILIALSFGMVFYRVVVKEWPMTVAFPFVLNLLANLAFSPIQFGLQSNILAAADIFLVLGTLLWAMIVIYPYASWITYMQVPYLVWVMFATVLQFTITVLNW